MILGSHLSVAGGLHKALEAAADFGFETLALFVRNPRGWKAPPLSGEAVRQFKETRRQTKPAVIVAHASYLENLAGEDAIRAQSMTGLVDELQRCSLLGIEYLVLHPGSCADLDTGMERIVKSLDEVMAAVPSRGTKLLLETMAGQGNSIGARFEQLAWMLGKLRRPGRYGVCLDTAHIFAAGYDLRTPKVYKETMDAFERIIGWDRLRAIHCNDSAKPLGSRVDRHAHIGQGEIGRAGFAHLVRDPRLREIPFILETPKGRRESDGREWDAVNAEVLRRLASAPRRPANSG